MKNVDTSNINLESMDGVKEKMTDGEKIMEEVTAEQLKVAVHALLGFLGGSSITSLEDVDIRNFCSQCRQKLGKDFIEYVEWAINYFPLDEIREVFFSFINLIHNYEVDVFKDLTDLERAKKRVVTRLKKRGLSSEVSNAVYKTFLKLQLEGLNLTYKLSRNFSMGDPNSLAEEVTNQILNQFVLGGIRVQPGVEPFDF